MKTNAATTVAASAGGAKAIPAASPAPAPASAAQANLVPSPLGPLHAAALAHLRGESNVRAALERGDIEALASVPGISERRAIEAVRTARGLVHDDAFLATAAARKVHDEVMERLLSFAATAHGRNRLRLLGFLPDARAATRHATAVMQDKQAVAGTDRRHAKALLARVRPFAEPPARMVTSRILLADEAADADRFARTGLSRWCSVASTDDAELAGGYDLALLVADDESPLADLENVLHAPRGTPDTQLFPEATVAWFAHNRDAIAACAELGALLGKASPAAQALGILDRPAPQSEAAPLRPVVEEIRKQLDLSLRHRVATVTITGADLLDSLGRKTPAPLAKAIEEVLAEGRKALHARTGRSFQPFAAGHPITVDDDEVARIERMQAFEARVTHFQHLQAVARDLAPLKAQVVAEAAAWQEFEVHFALGCFALQHDLHPARFADRLHFDDSIHLDLAGEPKEGVQRIAYRIGGDETVALLTGANSGGKTTLLEHMVQLVVMARMGLPVVGQDVEVPWVEELHYITARRSLDAGAFETFLRSFLPLAQGKARRLVLADEVESVTEMDAAARILGFFLDRLADSPSLAVIVSHMAPQILQHTTAPVRIDGIEATGLDTQNRLVVDRMPRIGRLARSTPELIVQRLAATSKGAEQELYRDLLRTFQGGEATPAPGPRPAKGTSKASISPAP